ncbi:hypothetical protein Asulf_01947 [Archaeoglobus sulfaticallidus PM70-1]|uniref:Uncharacterized protein n=1 Tax=Archaeoglobus sulfaticallidus PM70-1 TaxID=387631 RepID=N0BFW1_9EURY|nr:hypothetical protein [Archaeoglobus sulfaticallidus]AGK61913.1 hypothetical protein Asulf_01947 [Archaeoglobus sulfaticallidus PM70-1]
MKTKIAKVIWATSWICVWLTAFYHYKTVGEYFVSENMLSKIPLAYVAVESWFLLTVIVLMWLSWKLIELISDVGR